MGEGPAVLVTGAAGYVGRLCVAALAKRRSELSALVALDWTEVEPAERIAGVVYEQGDICDPALKDLFREHGIDTVVHLASIVRAPKGAPADLAYRVDVLGTKNVLEACEAVEAPRLDRHLERRGLRLSPRQPGLARRERSTPGQRRVRVLEEQAHGRGHAGAVAGRAARAAASRLSPGHRRGPDVHSPVTDLFEKPVMLGIVGSDSPFVFIWDQDLVACLVDAVFSDKVGVYNQAGDGALTPREIAKMLNKPYVPLPASAREGDPVGAQEPWA